MDNTDKVDQGATGAGKTTLLEVLTGGTSIGVISGSIFVNGRARQENVQRKIGYVQQNDLHLASSSVREALQFSAFLRQGRDISRAEKLDYVETVLRMLDMEAYATAIVGEAGQGNLLFIFFSHAKSKETNVNLGLNIEQRKRLTIAVELVAKPELLLFLGMDIPRLKEES